ncbi:class I SAM-dependent methyltransferase [Reichenbachiella versicolor]|uniref:class I SAM-dependent methyltransferase n=1 Tax=Reichenbachiella versicolor TaxID=1821036 RepID=UPI000D6E0FE2|nr:methyltransferase [Reichenbachiella versicolor]
MAKYNGRNFERYDLSEDRSLRAWSAADEYLLSELKPEDENIALYHDRFGFLTANIADKKPQVVVSHMSQERAISANLENNELTHTQFIYPLDSLIQPANLALLKVPKSLELFEFYLQHIVSNSTSDVVVLCGFMTRHFSPSLVSIAQKYFEVVEQSLAKKKARILILKVKKSKKVTTILNTIEYNGTTYSQYPGVFSSGHVDFASQFLINHLEIDINEGRVLDLASGNGVIASEISKSESNLEFHLLDDSYLAVESARKNLSTENFHHHYDQNLARFENGFFDLIVTNPPFHFEYEINIQIPLLLLKESYRCLKKGGELWIVANQHLNYKTHLTKYFESTELISEDKKYVVYKCVK